MITVSTNINQVIGNLTAKVSRVVSQENIDKMLRTIAISTAGDMAHRIHTDGQKADGSQIGTYSEGYMRIRTDYHTNNLISRGPNKGKPKNKQSAGNVFTKGPKEGQQRPLYKREDDAKIVFSLTRQMENDFSLKESTEPIKTATGYGVGFKNPVNAEKAEWLEEKHPGTYKISENEKQKIRNIAENFINELNK